MGKENEWAILFRALTASVLLAAALGCSADNGMVEVAGEVTLEGEPVAEGMIGFVPVDGRGASAEALIEDGAYSVVMPAGKKKVVIYGQQQVGEKFPWGKDGQAMPILKEIVPARYNVNSQLTVDVRSGQNVHDFRLAAPLGSSP